MDIHLVEGSALMRDQLCDTSLNYVTMASVEQVSNHQMTTGTHMQSMNHQSVDALGTFLGSTQQVSAKHAAGCLEHASYWPVQPA